MVPAPSSLRVVSDEEEVVRNCTAETRLHIQKATFVHSQDPGMDEVYLGRGAASSLSIRIFLAEAERIGKASPLCIISSSSVTMVAIMRPPEEVGRERKALRDRGALFLWKATLIRGSLLDPLRFEAKHAREREGLLDQQEDRRERKL
jgi:hypothetical protein